MGEGELVSEDISVRTFLKWVFREEEGLCYLNHVNYFNESLLLFFFFLNSSDSNYMVVFCWEDN